MQPEFIRIRQKFDDTKIENIEQSVKEQIRAIHPQIRPGASIAITAGSRGIANIAKIIRATAEELRAMGAKPFIIPAMGSHGGATAEGQKQVLASYDITEEAMGVPIRSSMEVVELPRGDLPNRVFMDRLAYESDGVVIVNRVKPHTDFHGPTESGILKMCVIGLGKHRQAIEMHSVGTRGLRELMPMTARHVIQSGKILFALGIVENAYDQTREIRAALPQDMERVDAELLALARSNMPSLPAPDVDILIVDELGKEISGTGMDTNIIGRIKICGEEEPASPRVSAIMVTDLTEASHGNALGVGLADITTRRLFEKIDFRAMNENVMTSTFVERGKIPVVAQSDEQALQYCLTVCRVREIEKAKIVRIKNTLCVQEMYVTRPYLESIQKPVEVLKTGRLAFTGDGALPPVWKA